MLIGKSFVVGAEKRRPAVKLLLGMKLGTRQIDSAWQSCADEAQAAVLAELNEGVRGFHKLNPNRRGERWQAVGKN
ncbi:hypothetical protein AO063_26335 [Pseudomonas fluorescens ICMP 11288]|uniref:Uncharacterized protein n=1 Tax=Pseudomonas fluorescens ICMP 11288 TaxID=1198309 RepID=A0A0W0H3J6_PSEFL|nr:hypothetical protein AO063_26335 [Pseudomonas fluorescens ICMP 11288]